MSLYTDHELLEAIRRDDRGAFGEIFRRYWEAVYSRTFPKVRSEAVTQEIVQDTFITLWDKRASLFIHNLPSYLYAAAKNKVLNYIDAQLVRRRYWDYYRQFVPTGEESTANMVAYDELVEMIRDGMEGLPEKSRRIFRLNRLEGHSVAEIAALLNLSEKAIQYHLSQSVKKLRLHLKDYVLLSGFLCSLLS